MAAGAIVLPLEPAFLDALGLRWGWLNGLRAGVVAVTLVPLAAGMVSSTALPGKDKAPA